MGTWGTGLFTDDIACDIRDEYRELLEDQVEDDEATRLTIEKFRAYLDEPDGVALLALAVTQSTLGRLDPHIREQALAAIDRGCDLEAWEEENPKLLPKRRAVLEKARAQLTGPQPARKRLRRRKPVLSGLAAGEVLAFSLPRRVALLRVVRVRQHRLGETPVLEELDFDGAEVPPRDVLEVLAAKTKDTIAWEDPFSPDRRLSAFVAADRIDWQAAGFQKVDTISARAGDEEAPLPSQGVSWAALAESYRSARG
jgi:hypothetical protein